MALIQVLSKFYLKSKVISKVTKVQTTCVKELSGLEWLNPFNAETAYVQVTKTQRFLKTI